MIWSLDLVVDQCFEVLLGGDMQLLAGHWTWLLIHAMRSCLRVICSSLALRVVDCVHVVYWWVAKVSMLCVSWREVCGQIWCHILTPWA